MVCIMSLVKWTFSNMATLALIKFLKNYLCLYVKDISSSKEFEVAFKSKYSKSTNGKISKLRSEIKVVYRNV